MCFSATASFVTGSALSASGLVTIHKTKKKREMPLASIPLIFGAQQIIEGFVWLSFGTGWFNIIATYAYSFFSHVFWPVFLPFAVYCLEKDSKKKKFLLWFIFLGSAVSLFILYFILTEGITSQIVNRCIAYNSPHPYQNFILTLYVIATCGSCLISSHKIVNIFGLVMLTSLFATVWFFRENLVSVWCFFAAILSWLIYLQIARKKTGRRTTR